MVFARPSSRGYQCTKDGNYLIMQLKLGEPILMSETRAHHNYTSCWIDIKAREHTSNGVPDFEYLPVPEDLRTQRSSIANMVKSIPINISIEIILYKLLTWCF